MTAVVVTGGSYVDLPGFDPAISRWVSEWDSNVSEFQVAPDGWWPANPATLTTITGRTADDTQQRLVVLPGQFGRPLPGVTRSPAPSGCGRA